MHNRRTLLALAGAAALPFGAIAQPVTQPITVPPPVFDLQGHRGARALLPENSLAGFALALELGVNTLELDIAITKDGVLVITHDRGINVDITRGPDGQFLSGKGPAVKDLTFEEVQRFDVGRIRPGTKYASDFAEQKPLDGTRIPKLSDLFDMVKKSGNDKVRFAIETKLSPLAPEETLPPEAFARAVIAEIRKAGMQNRSAVISFDWRTLQVVQKEAPEIQTGYITIQTANSNTVGRDHFTASPWTAGFKLGDHGGSLPRTIKAAGGHTWSSFHGDLNPALVKEAQSLGLKVLAWTVNAPARIVQILDMGVDGIVTDRPDLVRAEMQKRGMPLPAPAPVAR
ncbi:glycerophosphodiester phosphodiesterase [Caenimonas sedimenti]|uniref:Glycerophosphodiester phosphodiesterase n=1 Tax=Caenimonas sedimenti TaxID=2596921 RepID=A0A562ZG41_9BURK|nr:glycerophosphodiester phosphodiesterase [Caenimonas sedimenti]TWO66948.1 glycerophosphodiester phosphodiesterase [Caenimonas sedimenti]